MIRILLVEDQTMVLGALAALLELEDDIEVVGRAPDGSSALKAIGEQNPDIVVTDIEMPGMDGLTLAAELREHHPEIRTVVLTTFARPGYLRRAMQAGVRGYLLKDGPAEELADAIRRIAQGGRVIAPELAAEAMESEDPLTERERQVLRLAGEGHTARDIAAQVYLSEGTVRNYLSEAMAKLGATNRIEAVNIARERGLL